VTVVPLPTWESLREYVRQTLCAHDTLETESTPFYAAPIRRRGRVCGYLFHIVGPRQMKNSAIWAEDEHRLFFYDAIGTRFEDVYLSDAPAIEQVEKRAA